MLLLQLNTSAVVLLMMANISLSLFSHLSQHLHLLPSPASNWESSRAVTTTTTTESNVLSFA